MCPVLARASAMRCTYIVRPDMCRDEDEISENKEEIHANCRRSNADIQATPTFININQPAL